MFFFIFAVASGSGSAQKITVNPGDSIQDAVDAAPPEGAIIIIEPGIYYEYVEINKENLTLRSAKGPDETFIFGTTRCNDVIQVIASNTTISGFSVSVNETTKAAIKTDTHGICLNSNIKNCTVENNNVTNNDIGINLNVVEGFTVKNNEVSNNGVGIRLRYASGCYLDSNEASNNSFGICLYESVNNVFTHNVVSSSVDCGIDLDTSENNLIYNNYFNNTNNADDNNANIWNTTTGNYWSDYTGKDEDGDGIGESAYSITQGTSVDYRPLVNFVFEPPEPPAPILPVANFITNVTSGKAPLAVEFTDLSENVSERAWDFNNDGVVDSIEEIAVYVFEDPGNYTVNLKVSNGNGSDSKEIVDFITVEVADDTGDSGDSGDSDGSDDSEESGDSVSSSRGGGGDGTGSARIVHREKLEHITESDIPAKESDNPSPASRFPSGNSEKSDEYEAPRVQKNTGDSVKASGYGEKEDGGKIPRFVLPIAGIGLVSVAYLVRRGKMNN